MENPLIQTSTQLSTPTTTLVKPQNNLQEVAPNPLKKKFKNILIIVLILLFLLASGIIAYLIYQKSLIKKQSSLEINPSTTPRTSQDSSLLDPAADWKTYENEEYGYSIEYPANWQVTQDITHQMVIHEGSEPHMPTPYQSGRMTISQFGATDENNLEVWFDKFFYSKDSPADPDTLAQLTKEGIITSQNGLEVLKTSLPSEYLYFFIADYEVLSLSANLTENTEENKKLDEIYARALNSLQLTFQSVEIIGDECSPKETFAENELNKHPECEANKNCYWKSLGSQTAGVYACCPKMLEGYPRKKVYNGVKIQLNLEDLESLLRCLLTVD